MGTPGCSGGNQDPSASISQQSSAEFAVNEWLPAVERRKPEWIERSAECPLRSTPMTWADRPAGRTTELDLRRRRLGRGGVERPMAPPSGGRSGRLERLPGGALRVRTGRARCPAGGPSQNGSTGCWRRVISPPPMSPGRHDGPDGWRPDSGTIGRAIGVGDRRRLEPRSRPGASFGRSCHTDRRTRLYFHRGPARGNSRR